MKVAIRGEPFLNNRCMKVILGLVLAALVPAQVSAQILICDGAFEGTSPTPGPFFEGDTIRIDVSLEAIPQPDYSFIGFPGFDYYLDCGSGDGFPNCTDPAENDIEYVGNITTNCVNDQGDPIQWQATEANLVSFTATNGPAWVQVGDANKCNVSFDIILNTVGASPRIFYQVFGSDVFTCDNGLTGAASGSLAAFVSECSIDLVKEVSADGGANWFDANAPTGPNLEFPPGDALYRLIVTNDGTADFVEPIVINDTELGIVDATIPLLLAGDSVIVGEGDITELNALGRCTQQGALENVSDATGVCRAEADGLVDSNDFDNAWVNCVPPPEIDILKEVSVDGGANWFDANPPGGPFPPEVEAPAGAMYRITVTNTGGVDLVNVIVDDPLLGIAGHLLGFLAAGDFVVLDSGDIPALDVAVRCDAPGEYDNTAFANGESAETGTPADEVSDPARMICFTEGLAVCRTPGFWGARGGDEKADKGSRNITQEVICMGDPDCPDPNAPVGFQVCGIDILDTDEGSGNSAIEAICINRGDPKAKYIRHATSASLNCILGDCGYIADLLVDCNADCIAGDVDAMNACGAELDCFNNGGMYIDGICHYDYGSCHPAGSDGVGGSGQACSFDEDGEPLIACDTLGEVCYPDENCHERNLCPDLEDDGEINNSDFCFEPPGPASSSKKCSQARKNGKYIWEF